MRINKQAVVAAAGALVAGVLVVSVAVAEDFPYRKDFPKVTVISSQELKAKYDRDEVILVDVRSEVEYGVLRVAKAAHIPMSYATFVDEVTKLSKASPRKTIVFYCNGVTCLKSYESAQKMMEAGSNNCVAYDAGIPEWSKLYPAETLVFGEVLRDPAKQLISDEEFNKHLIDFDTFKAKAASPNALVIDIREGIQRSATLPGLESARVIPLDVMVPNLVAKKAEQDKTLLVFDQVGKQVKWLMYYLRANGYENYYFLDKQGATSVLKKQEYK